MGISKNRLNEKQIRTIISRAYPEHSVVQSTELTSGLCNALYLVELENDNRIVLKVASAGSVGKMRSERWLMHSEVSAMQTIAEVCPVIPAPRLLFYDDTLTVCSGEYFIMEYKPGQLMRGAKEKLPQTVQDDLFRELGRLVRSITDIVGEKFGIMNSGISFDTQYELTGFMLENYLSDMKQIQVDIPVSPENLREKLEQDKAYFDEVVEPRFVHYDIWENNVLLDGDKISAIIDWERALWGDPLMEERFRMYALDKRFCEGFGLKSLSEAQARRCRWYDILMDLSMMEEPFIREYEDKSQYYWAKALFEEAWRRLNSEDAGREIQMWRP